MMSVSSTCRNTPSSSPKSPPNRLLLVHLQSFYLYPPSPNVELADIKEFKEQLKLQGVFINREPEHKGEFWNLLCFDKDLDRLIGDLDSWPIDRSGWRLEGGMEKPAKLYSSEGLDCTGRPSFFFWLHRSTIMWGGKIRSYVSTSGEQENGRKGQGEGQQAASHTYRFFKQTSLHRTNNFWIRKLHEWSDCSLFSQQCNLSWAGCCCWLLALQTFRFRRSSILPSIVVLHER